MNNARLAVAKVVRLQPRKNQIRIFRRTRLRQQPCNSKGIARIQFLFFDVECPVGTLRQRLANRLSRSSRPRAQCDDLAPVLFLQLQGSFQSVRIGLVDFESEIRRFNPLACAVDPQLRIASGYLFDGNNNFHTVCDLAGCRKSILGRR